jgi:PPP family 3-phenylpropionic acid transporter
LKSAGTVAPFGFLSAAYFAHIGFFNPYLPLWLKHLGYGAFAIGVLTAMQSMTRVVAPYAWGALADRTGRRVGILRYCSVVALVSAVGLTLPFFWPALGVAAPGWALALIVATLALMFLHTSSMMPMAEAAMSSLVSGPDGFDARRYGRVRVWGSVGFMCTALAMGTWFEVFTIAHFPLWAVASLGVVVWACARLPDLREPTHGADAAEPLGPVLAQPSVRWFFVALFFHVLAHVSVYLFFSLYLDALGYSKAVIGLLWAVSVATEIVWFFTQGRWLPLLSLHAWLMLGAALGMLRFGVIAGLAASLAMLVLAQALHAITFAAHHTACVALLNQHFAARLRGRGQALYTIVGYGLTGVVGGFGGGALASRFGYGLLFWLALGCSALALLAAWRARWLGGLGNSGRIGT